MAGIKKLRANAKAHLAEIVARRKQKGHYNDQIERVPLAEHEKLLANAELWERSLVEPVLIPICVGVWEGKWFATRQYLFQDAYWETDVVYTDEQMKLLVKDAFDSERRKFERLEQQFSGSGDTKATRPSIPESVRIEVWRRDQGVCVRCGSRDRLEYDHIIPVAKGGGNTARNIELLCEVCNQKKGDLIQ